MPRNVLAGATAESPERNQGPFASCSALPELWKWGGLAQKCPLRNVLCLDQHDQLGNWEAQVLSC